MELEFELRSGPPHTGSPGPLGAKTPEESEKSLEESPGQGPKSAEKSAPRRPKRVQKLTESQALDSEFLDSFGPPGRTLRHFWGPAPGYSFRTLFGLFRVLARRARETLWGAGPIATQIPIPWGLNPNSFTAILLELGGPREGLGKLCLN